LLIGAFMIIVSLFLFYFIESIISNIILLIIGLIAFIYGIIKLLKFKR
jgi:uncharacterized membrane protein